MSNDKPRRTTQRSLQSSARDHHSRESAGRFELSLQLDTRKTQSPKRSPDPYNSSGSFDRAKNWARVGKR